MKRAPAFLVFRFVSALFVASAFSSNAEDIESLLDQAEALSSPLLTEKLCEADAKLIASSQTAENGVISVTLEQACYIETGEERLIAIEGLVQNLNASTGLSMTVADKFLQLSINGIRQPALPNLGSLEQPDFFAPFGHGLDVNPQFAAQRRARSLRSLYKSSDCVRSRGAPV